MAIPFLLDTDIGTDVDDAWALALALASPEIDLIGVTLVHADLDTRAKIAHKMLVLAGQAHVPVYRGLSETLTPGGQLYWAGHEGAGTDFSGVDGMYAPQGAVDFLARALDSRPGEVVLCSVGPLTNVGELARAHPKSLRNARLLAVMASTFEGMGSENAGMEHNARVDPVATRAALGAGVAIVLVGLNVTTRVAVRRDDLRRIRGKPFGDYLAAMTDAYIGIGGRTSTNMHDPLTVAAVLDPDVLKLEPMLAEVLDDGRIVFGPVQAGKPAIDVAVDVDVDRFEEMLLTRIESYLEKGV